MTRRSAIDLKYVGDEPTITSAATDLELIKAYNYYNYFYNTEDAKSFVIAFLKSRKVPKLTLKKAQQLRAIDVQNIGWNCRLMYNGSSLPEDIRLKSMSKLQSLIDKVILEKEEDEKPVITVQDRIENKASELIGDLENQIDNFLNDHKIVFDAANWFSARDVKAVVAKKIAEYYQPLYEEIYEAVQGKDADLKYAYRNWKKADIKKYLELIKNILSAAEVASAKVSGTRKQRKKKVKPASVIVSKLKYQAKDEALKIESIKPTEIVAAQQLWVYNTKNRALSVYNALGPAGLTVKGTSIMGFDDKTSITKRLRKPEITLPKLMESGKVGLRKLMEDIKTVEKPSSGRINSDTILLRVSK